MYMRAWPPFVFACVYAPNVSDTAAIHFADVDRCSGSKHTDVGLWPTDQIELKAMFFRICNNG